ncbi:MAG: endonuclease/exonuclease/phosphatase family protein [Filimonas sp.]|nr:endonuclease/exonuclease/phosphatase family protein [Filimonas sp.]
MRRILFVLLLIAVQQTSLHAQHFNIGTYNLRYANHGDSVKGNGWGQRCPVIANMVRYHQFDIFGTQEGLYSQLQSLKDSLPGYTYIGVGRDDGKQAGEHSAIFYRTDKFQLVESGNFWLSTITDKPNKGWDAVLPRICTWGKFKEKSSGFTFIFFNLHMDHVGVQARSESAKLIFEKIKAMPANTPAILTGDFNIDQNNPGYTLINTSGILRDAYELSPVKLATNGTFNNFDANSFTASRIDHIFVSKNFNVKRYGILTDTYRTNENPEDRKGWVARTPSDHYPVLIEVEVAKKK